MWLPTVYFLSINLRFRHGRDNSRWTQTCIEENELPHWCICISLFYWSANVSLVSSSIEHLPLSMCSTYFPSSFAQSPSPLCIPGHRGQVIPLTLAETDIVHMWSSKPVRSCKSFRTALHSRLVLSSAQFLYLLLLLWSWVKCQLVWLWLACVDEYLFIVLISSHPSWIGLWLP